MEYNMMWLIRRWEKYVALKDSYIFGTEKIDLEDYGDLIGMTYDVIRTVRSRYIFKGEYPDAAEMMQYVELISELSQYGVDDGTVLDESENYAFSATVLIADALRIYATRYDSEETEGGTVYIDHDKKQSGDLIFPRNNYVGFMDDDDEREGKIYIYNVYDRNFDDILDLAQQIAEQL